MRAQIDSGQQAIEQLRHALTVQDGRQPFALFHHTLALFAFTARGRHTDGCPAAHAVPAGIPES